MAFFWFRNPLVLVAESPFFGCGIVFFWLRNRLFLVAEAPFFGCGSVSDFGCGIAEIWLRKRRNMVSESEFMHAIRMIKFSRFQDTLYSLPQISL